MAIFVKRKVDEQMNLFAENEDGKLPVGNQLEKTARLTSQASMIANDILKAIQTIDEENKTAIESLVKESMTSHEKMDDLIEQLADLNNEDVDYLKTESEDTIAKMIKSQQSKRSRGKGKVMTMENYRQMLIGAVAENLIRIAANKPKNQAASVEEGKLFSEEELQKLTANPAEIARVIRNVQSKKSIAKHKADFNAESPKWKHIIALEEQLIAARDGGTSRAVNTAVISKLKEALANVQNVNELPGKDAKTLLAQMMELINSPNTKD